MPVIQEEMTTQCALDEIVVWIKALTKEGVSADKAAEIAADVYIATMDACDEEYIDEVYEDGEEEE